MKKSNWFIITLLMFALVFPLTTMAASGHILKSSSFKPKVNNVSKKDSRKVKPKVLPSKTLPVVGSFENLKALLSKADKIRFAENSGNVLKVGITQDTVTAALPASNYSTTNVQVQGVDEADLVKTDGKYIYQVTSWQVVVSEVYSPENMKMVSQLKFDDRQFVPSELYVDSKHLVVIGSTVRYLPGPLPPTPILTPQKTNPPSVNAPLASKPSTSNGKEIAPSNQQVPAFRPDFYPPIPAENTVKTIIYDISDKTNLKKVREVELEGTYLSSRKIGPSLYLIVNKYINYYSIMNTKLQPTTTPSFAPAYRDSIRKRDFVSIAYQDIRYFPECVEPNYLMIAGINLDQPQQQLKLTTYLSSGQNIFASQANLYIAVNQYAPAVNTGITGKLVKPIRYQPAQASTTIHKFALQQGQANYSSKGTVPGTILNQFSMDEYKGSFRIATTSGDTWRNDEYTSKNQVYVLDETLKISGKLEGIAPGERIYSVRFMGDRAYVVTFKQVDPLFVLELSDPKSPKILGALKIPGYSEYLHPYDANHIIGFGKDTVELPQKADPGNPEQTIAYYQGLKIAIFDVSDVNNPVEKFKETIGDRGTYSELLQYHKALLFVPEKNILAFPVTLMEIKTKQSDPNSSLQYGEFTYQGAYVYKLDLTNGFKLKGRITHLTDDELQKSGNGLYNDTNYVQRILYIGESLYTISQGMIKANELSSLRELGSLTISE